MTDDERWVLVEQSGLLTTFYEQDHARILRASEIDDLVLRVRDNIEALLVLDNHERKV